MGVLPQLRKFVVRSLANALSVACCEDHAEAVQAVLEISPDEPLANLIDEKLLGGIPIRNACCEGSLNTLKVLLRCPGQRGDNIKGHLPSGLELAAAHGHVHIVRCLLGMHCEAILPARSAMVALHASMSGGQAGTTQELFYHPHCMWEAPQLLQCWCAAASACPSKHMGAAEWATQFLDAASDLRLEHFRCAVSPTAELAATLPNKHSLQAVLAQVVLWLARCIFAGGEKSHRAQAVLVNGDALVQAGQLPCVAASFRIWCLRCLGFLRWYGCRGVSWEELPPPRSMDDHEAPRLAYPGRRAMCLYFVAQRRQCTVGAHAASQ